MSNREEAAGSEPAAFVFEVPEGGGEAGAVEDGLGFGDGPLVPVGAGVGAVPEGGELGDLVEGNGLALGKAMAVAPGRDFVRGVERQDHGAVLMDVVPGARGRDGEVDDEGF